MLNARAAIAAIAVVPMSLTTPANADVGVDYYAPKLSASFVLTLSLESCTRGPGGILATASGSVTSKAERDASRMAHLDAGALSSLSRKKEVAIALTDDFTLKSINMVVEDRTGAIIVSALKAVAGIVAMAAAPDRNAVLAQPCNQTTMRALGARDALSVALMRRRAELAAAPADRSEQISKAADAIAANIAALSTGPLSLTLTAPFKLDRGAMSDQPITWSLGDLAKWFAQEGPGLGCRPVDAALFDASSNHPGCAATTTMFSAQYTITDAESRFTPGATDTACYEPSAAAREGCKGALVLLTPATASVVVTSTSGTIDGIPTGAKLGQADLVVPQWGHTELVPIKIGFGGSRTLALSFDTFGRVTSFGVKSDAQLESVLGTTNGALDVVSGAIKAQQGTKVASWKAEIEELETEQKWNALRACRAAIEAGATACPAVPAQ